MMSALGKGVYTFREAHRLTKVPLTTIRRWFLGGEQDGGLIQPDYAQTSGRHYISFLDLVDAYVAARFRHEEGIPFRRLKPIYRNLVKRFGSRHAFCRDLRTDGKTIFLEAAKEVGDSKLVDLFDDNLVIPKLLDPILTKVEFDPKTQLAKSWRLYPGVVIDPQRNFGKPSIEQANIATEAIADLLLAESDLQTVADWFGLSPQLVRVASEFERSLAA